MTENNETKLSEFIQELKDFAQVAENTLKTIESDLLKHKELFSVFYERMFAIRGTSQQLGLNHIAHIAGLGEEISVKATKAEAKGQIRRCVGSLWDALTTIQYLLQHPMNQTTEEQQILIHRLEETIRILGGPRPTLDEDEIQKMLKQSKNK